MKKTSEQFKLYIRQNDAEYELLSTPVRRSIEVQAMVKFPNGTSEIWTFQASTTDDPRDGVYVRAY
jgi:phage pi2 protein 07